MATDIEKKSLEAHVDLCAERYKNLEDKLGGLEKRMDKIEEYIIEIKDSLVLVSAKSQVQSQPQHDTAGPYKTMIAIGTTIFGALIGVIATLIVHVK